MDPIDLQPHRFADDELNFIDEAALDTYVFTRESFLQYRKNLITDGQLENTDDLLDLDEDFDEDDDEVVGQENVKEEIKSGTVPEAETIENKVQQQDSLDEVVKSIDESGSSENNPID